MVIPETSDVPRGTSTEYAQRAAIFAGLGLSEDQIHTLQLYADWLITEAVPAGGLGPREGERLWQRHIGDSLTFAAGWSDVPPEILDVGTGVGLPGIPLAVLFPDTMVTLLDRGGRRVRLVHRAVRILDLPNVVIAKGDAFSVADYNDRGFNAGYNYNIPKAKVDLYAGYHFNQLDTPDLVADVDDIQAFVLGTKLKFD